ncbi:uncharacterized protein LOC135149116 [Daucus carota subsp. sativus]|uniref:uncharacterized protein LOC135149116 n=1 Tax=Daucus carota subsp. sativus TaxID=79200 RepID=UPI003082C2D7
MRGEMSVEDEFSKMHPCYDPIRTRIAIVGAGPSGLSAAYALSKLGYSDITVLEKHHSVGGMCESVELEGRIYDLGGQVLAENSAPTIFHLAKEIGAKTEKLDKHKFATIDSSSGEYNDSKVVDDYVSVISLTLKIQDQVKDSDKIGVHAVSEIASDSAPRFLETHGFKAIPKSVAYGYTASGYGYVQDMPYAYVHEFTRTSMAGKIRRFEGGYTSVWRRLSESLPINVRCDTEVLEVKRDSGSVAVSVRGNTGEEEVLEFDKIIISGSFPFRSAKTYRASSSITTENGKEVMVMSELERELFGKVYIIDYYTTALKIKGFEHIPMGFYYFAEFMDDPTSIGNPVAMQKFYADTDIFLFWSYGNSTNIKGEEIIEFARNAVARMGGEVVKTILQRRFRYFPHIKSQDMKDGFYNRMESELQGQLNTYYVGGLMAFELTERNSTYAMALVRKHFANNNLQPKFPYVKRLFTLQSHRRSGITKKLDESPGLEFPDLFSLDDFLRHWGTHSVTGNKILYNWINEKGEITSKRTYRELHENAYIIAHKLLTSHKPAIKPGDRVLLVYMPGLEFIDAFFGCLRARVIPVPVIPPDPSQKAGQTLLHIQNIANKCNAVAILSTKRYHISVRAFAAKNIIFLAGKSKSSPQWPDLPWLHTDSFINKSNDGTYFQAMAQVSKPLPEDLCFLQFTSGSTGDAKGVMITHGGLIHNVKLMRKKYKSTSKTVLVSWLPQYHDMGLIGGLFTSLVSGGSAILFSPVTFIKNPLLWLQTMSKYQATHSAGPNFAFELIIRRLDHKSKKEQNKELNLDLSSMVFLMVAAEPVRQGTIKRFIELTQPFGLSQEVIAPGYGLAENCVYVSSAFGEKNSIMVDWQGRVCCGYVDPNDPDVEFRIVDPETGKEHEESEKEGEIWISSPSAGIGYWGMEDLSQKTFRNKLKGQTGKVYTRTGDLGRIIRGKLFITGRIKDLIIVAGRNIYSSDIEKTVEASSEVLRPGCCAVIGVPEEILLSKQIHVPGISDQVGLVVIAEVRDDRPFTENVIEHIQNRVAEEHGITIAKVVLIKSRSIAKTTSGKIKRFQCLKQFTDGTLNTIQQPRVEEKRKSTNVAIMKNCLSESKYIQKKDIIDFLRGLLSEQTGIPTANITITESLMSYGVDSIGVVRAAQKLSTYLGQPVGAIDIFTATCIEDLADFAEGLLQKSRPQSITDPSPMHQVKTPSVKQEKVLSSHKLAIWFYQVLALIYISFLLIIPSYFSVSAFTTLVSGSYSPGGSSWVGYLVSLICAPLVWLLCIFSTCISISFFGNSFLQPNYALSPEISIWSVDFIKWWALCKVQQAASNVFAVHLRGTIFAKYWFQMLGAKIGSSVLIDTVDITDPYLVSIGDEAVIAEGALIQGHEVRNGILRLNPIRIGCKSSVGPFAVIQKGSIVGDGATVAALQACEGGKSINKTFMADISKKEKVAQVITGFKGNSTSHFTGIYMVGFLSSLSAAITYVVYIWLSHKTPSLQHFGFLCLCGTFHWLPFTIIAYATMLENVPSSPFSFALLVSIGHLAHGVILCFLTSICVHLLSRTKMKKNQHFVTWLQHRITVSCHLRFAKFLSGTEAFSIYFRLMGAKIGQHCSIRAVNPISDPKLVSIGDGVHLGDFCRIVPGFYNSTGFVHGKVQVQENSVVGSQGLILPGSNLQKDVFLGALSVAPVNSVLQQGGVFVGSQTPVMVRNSMLLLDDRIEEMDRQYKKVLGNLAANLAATTLKVNARYFHRIGAGGKGTLKLYADIPGFPTHKVFYPGKSYPITLRHSNCLSSDDDARLDPRGAALRILSDERNSTPVLDLTLKTGKAFHARSIGDFATWLVCGAAAREEHVKHVPHIREAMWDSLRQANSYTELHYYSNITRIFRFEDGQEMYAKFKLRPFDKKFDEDSGKVEPRGLLPPETGAIPRDENDKRPLLFLERDFQHRVNSPDRVKYILQLQMRAVPEDEITRETALDCTKPWDDDEFPYIEIGEIVIDQVLTKEESEALEFNPFLRCHEIDVIRAKSCSQSASMDHGRSIVYSICQHLRNKKPLPESWKMFLDQSDVKLDLSGCPMAGALEKNKVKRVTLARPWHQNLWMMTGQPILQIVVPYFLMALVMFEPLNAVLSRKESMNIIPVYWLISMLWISTGLVAGLVCALAKWVLVGKKRDGEIVMIWSIGVFMDTTWQAIRTLVDDYFMQMVGGSVLYNIWMVLMGSQIDWDDGVYVDSCGATLNPEMVEIKRNGSVERGALLFGHIYEGEQGKVKYGKICVKEGGFVGSRAVAMPGVTVENEACLAALSLAMKGENIK